MKRELSKDGIRQIINEDGSIRYEARVNRAGEKPISKRFKTKSAAKKWKRGLDTSVDDGKPILSNKTLLIRRIIDEYIAYRKHTLKPISYNQQTEYERVSLDFGAFSIGKLTRQDLINWMNLLMTTSRGKFKSGKDKPPYAEASVRRFYYAFKTAVEWHSAEFKYYVDEHLFSLPKGAIPGAWEGQRTRRLVEDEEQRLYSAGLDRRDTYTREDWENIIQFALETALREQELVFARWEDIRHNGFKLFVPAKHSKTKKERTVLLSGIARRIIENQRSTYGDNESRVFSQIPSPSALCDAFSRLTERAGIVDLHFHDLRHEATSRLCVSGKLNQMQIMEMTGHSSMTTFKGYLHLISHEGSVLLD